MKLDNTEKQSDLIDMGAQNKANGVTVFLHIPKAAGTTVDGVINKQFKKKSTIRIHGLNNIKSRLAKLPSSERHAIRLIRGHFAFGLHTFLDCPVRYFTIVRDPVKRVLSEYLYIKRSPNVPGHKIAKDATLEEYLEKAQGNLQARMMLGLTQPKDQSDTGILTAIQENIRDHFSMTGMVESFEESLMLLHFKLDWQVNSLLYVSQNKTSSNQSKAIQLSPDLIELIKEKNHWDVLLYEYIEECFHNEITKLSPAFEDKLRYRAQLNRLYNPFGKSYNLMRKAYFDLKQINK